MTRDEMKNKYTYTEIMEDLGVLNGLDAVIDFIDRQQNEIYELKEQLEKLKQWGEYASREMIERGLR